MFFHFQNTSLLHDYTLECKRKQCTYQTCTSCPWLWPTVCWSCLPGFLNIVPEICYAGCDLVTNPGRTRTWAANVLCSIWCPLGIATERSSRCSSPWTAPLKQVPHPGTLTCTPKLWVNCMCDTTMRTTIFLQRCVRTVCWDSPSTIVRGRSHRWQPTKHTTVWNLLAC